MLNWSGNVLGKDTDVGKSFSLFLDPFKLISSELLQFDVNQSCYIPTIYGQKIQKLDIVVSLDIIAAPLKNSMNIYSMQIVLLHQI